MYLSNQGREIKQAFQDVQFKDTREKLDLNVSLELTLNLWYIITPKLNEIPQEDMRMKISREKWTVFWNTLNPRSAVRV